MNSNKKASYVNQIPELTIGHWIAITGDGLVGDGDNICFKTKRDAIDWVSGMFLDPRPKPKVTRIHAGSYEYFPKDVETGEFLSSCDIIKLNQNNIEQYREMWKDQVERDEYGIE